MAEATAGAAWSFFVTYIILYTMNRIPGLSLRVDHQVEIDGLDVAEIGELAYYQVNKVIGIDARTGEQKVVAEEMKSVSNAAPISQGMTSIERVMSDPGSHHQEPRSPHALNNP